MTKINVYIDFEAISQPFSKHANLIENFPFAYTLGIFRGKKIKTKSYVFNFEKDDVDNVFPIIKKQIIKDIRNLLTNKRFQINEKTTKFIGWAPHLEVKILSNVFRDIEVDKLNKNHDLSLERLTPEIKGEYFKNLQQMVKKNLKSNFIEKRISGASGALAALAGYLLYSKVDSGVEKYTFEFSARELIKEIKRYSRDDVTRMMFLKQNMNLYHKREQKALEIITKKQKIIRSIIKRKKLLSELKKLSPDKTIGEIKEETQKNINKLTTEKEKIDDKLDNLDK